MIDFINEIITEELGISKEVVDVSNKMISDILSNIKKNDYDNRTDGILTKSFSITNVSTFGKLLAKIVFYNFRNIDEYNEFIEKDQMILDSSSYFHRGLMWIELNVIAISGKIDKERLFELLFHEVEHVFQESKMKKTFGNVKNYNTALSKIHSENKLERCVALIVYCSQKSEQEGFANGLYGFLLSNYAFGYDFKDIVKKSEAYKKLEDLNNAIIQIENHKNDEFVKNECLLYGLTIQKLITVGKESLDSLTRRFGKIIVKYKKDIENNTRHSYNLPNDDIYLI